MLSQILCSKCVSHELCLLYIPVIQQMSVNDVMIDRASSFTLVGTDRHVHTNVGRDFYFGLGEK